MKRWFTSDAGRWFVIGAVSSSLVATLACGPHDDVSLLLSVLLLIGLLTMVTLAVHGPRRPWLRTLELEERPDGQIVAPDLDATFTRT